jgi:TetR/AcrR family transcriptional regulator, tetracycline repressor protein
MRALAQELGVPVMTIYNYVPNKEALYELVTDVVLGAVQVPAPAEGTWEERLQRLEHDARAALARYPGVTLDRRRDSAEGRRLAAGVLSILADAGFAPADAALAFATLFTFMIGQIDVDVDASETGGPAAEAVQSAALASGRTRDEIFEFGFDAVLEGLKVKLGRRSGT